MKPGEIKVVQKGVPGETKVVQEGTPGEIKHIVKVTVDSNGEVSKEESSEEISQSSPCIIEVGPAKGIDAELTVKHTEMLPYDTLIEYDPNLEAGKVVEDQAGSTGQKEITRTWKLVDGVPVGEPETSETVTKEKQDREIRVGTKCNCETPDNPEQPGTPNKPGAPGKSSTPSQPGSKGSVSTGSSATSGSTGSQKQVDSPRMSTLASTGANVLGVFAVGLALIIGAIPLLRRRHKEGEA